MRTCSCKNVKLKRKKGGEGEGRINNKGRLVVEETKKNIRKGGKERKGEKEGREREKKR